MALRILHRLGLALFAGILLVPVWALGETGEVESVNDVLRTQAESVRPLIAVGLGRQFLDAVPDLPKPQARTVFYDSAAREALTPEEARTKSAEELEGFEEKTLDEQFYYFTKYGTPLAFVRPLDILSREGFNSVDGGRLVDFGFGSIGQLRLLASLGAHAVGIEVDPLLRALYRAPGDTGRVVRAQTAGPGRDGRVTLLWGRFPAEVGSALGGGFDAFLSKNTLKNGYLHPAEEVDPRMLVHLGVEDVDFVRAVHNLLKPNGYFMIYNLHPAQLPDKYIPWADGRCPFSRALCEEAGFEVIEFDRDDTESARAMGRAFGWAEQMDLEKDLFGIYTLLRKPSR